MLSVQNSFRIVRMLEFIFFIPGYLHVILWFHINGGIAHADNSSQYIIEELFDGYNDKTSPTFGTSGGNQLTINMSILIVSMYSIRESSMDYSISMFLRQHWYDKRLAFSHINHENLTRLELDPRSRIWVPDVYILNEKAAYFHDVTLPNKLIHVHPDGWVKYVVRVSGSFTCPMDLQKYPFDSQDCFLELESFGHNTDALDFRWVENPVDRTMALDFPQFALLGYHPYRCTRDYYGVEYPCLGVKFYLRRNYGYHVIQIYVPSILIVLLSWLNFWLDCTSAPARISLGLLTVLTMTTQLSGARADLPPVSYIKAIDVWMSACLTFVVMGLVEFAVVNVLTRTSMEIIQDKSKGKNTKAKVARENCVWSLTRKILCVMHVKKTERAVLVDKISRVLFPVAFTTFNIVYWVMYVVL